MRLREEGIKVGKYSHTKRNFERDPFSPAAKSSEKDKVWEMARGLRRLAITRTLLVR